MHRKLIYYICVLIGLINLSCSQREVYFQFQEIKDVKWSKYDTLVFDIDSSIIVLNQPLNIELEVVNDTDYPYQNIWFYIEDDFLEDAGNLKSSEREYELANIDGKWHGSGFGSLYQLSLKYKTNIVFSEKRNYQLKIVQGMRDEPLIGIEKIGVKISLPD